MDSAQDWASRLVAILSRLSNTEMDALVHLLESDPAIPLRTAMDMIGLESEEQWVRRLLQDNGYDLKGR